MLGWRVHPCDADKRPLTRWKEAATDDVDQVIRWWDEHPNAHVGIRTGDGVVVVDVDDPAALTQAERQWGQLPTASRVATRRGHHYYLSTTEAAKTGTQLGTIPHLDSRGEGGYVIFWGDEPLDPDNLPAVPPGWRTVLRRPPDPAEGVAPAPAPAPAPADATSAQVRLHEVLAMLAQPQAGERHQQCLRMARLVGGWVAAGALDSTSTLPLLLQAVAGHADASDSRRAIEDGYRHGLQSPRAPDPIPEPQPTRPVAPHPLEGLTHLHDGTGLSNAGLLVALAQNNYRYVHESEQWLYWEADRGRWNASPYALCALHHLASQVALWHRRRSDRQPDDKALARYYRHAASGAGISEAVKLSGSGAYPEIPVSSGELDQRPGLINSAGQTFELATEAPYVRPRVADRADLLTRATAADYDSQATCPRWERFVNEIMAGNAAHAWFLQRLLGYALSGYCSEQRFFVMQGDGGNGKGALQRAITAALGSDYVATAKAETFLVRQYAEIPADAASLVGARFVFPEELPQNRRLDSTVLKGMSGKDPVKARLLHQNHFTYIPQFTLLFSANPGYEIDASDPAMRRRFVVIPFTVSFRDNPDKHLDAKLAAEGPGILRWLLDGWAGYCREGLQVPAEWADAADEVRLENDAVGQFLDERTQPQGSAPFSNEDIYQAYRTWAQSCGEEPYSQRKFSQALKSRGYEQKISQGKRQWIGLYPKNKAQGKQHA